jgi:hypothetical protein
MLKTTIYHRPCGRKKIQAWESHANSGRFKAKCVDTPGVQNHTGDFPWLPECIPCLIDVVDQIANALHTDELKTGSKVTNWRLPGGKRIFTQDA